MKKQLPFIHLIILLCICVTLQSQSQSWTTTIDHPMQIYVKSMTTVDQDIFLISENTAEDGLDDLILNKVSEDGNIIWSKSFSETDTHLRAQKLLSNKDTVYIIANDFVNFDGFLGSNILLIKVDSEGNVHSEKRMGSALGEKIRDIILVDNTFIVLGETTTNEGEVGWFISQMDLSGNILKLKAYKRSTYDYQFKIHPVAGGYLIGGQSITIDGPRLATLTQIDNEFNITGAITLEVSGSSNPGVFELFPMDNKTYVYAAIDNGSSEIILDQDWKLISSREVGSGITRGVMKLNEQLFLLKDNGGIFMTTEEGNKVAFVNPSGIGIQHHYYDNDNQILYSAGSGQQDNNWAYALRKSYEGNILGCDLEEYNYNSTHQPTVNISEIMWPSLNISLDIKDASLSINNLNQSADLSCMETSSNVNNQPNIIYKDVSPNPAYHTIQLDQWDNHFPILNIYNMAGQLVKSCPFSSNMDISDLKSGIYIIQSGHQTSRFIKL